MADLTVSIIMRRKWWFPAALYIGMFLLWAGLINDLESAEHYDGWISADERVANWLLTHALIIDVE